MTSEELISYIRENGPKDAASALRLLYETAGRVHGIAACRVRISELERLGRIKESAKDDEIREIARAFDCERDRLISDVREMRSEIVSGVFFDEFIAKPQREKKRARG